MCHGVIKGEMTPAFRCCSSLQISRWHVILSGVLASKPRSIKPDFMWEKWHRWQKVMKSKLANLQRLDMSFFPSLATLAAQILGRHPLEQTDMSYKLLIALRFSEDIQISPTTYDFGDTLTFPPWDHNIWVKCLQGYWTDGHYIWCTHLLSPQDEMWTFQRHQINIVIHPILWFMTKYWQNKLHAHQC